MPNTVRARAIVGFYRGADLIHPGQVVELGVNEFNELRGFQKVEAAPPEIAVAATQDAQQAPAQPAPPAAAPAPRKGKGE